MNNQGTLEVDLSTSLEGGGRELLSIHQALLHVGYGWYQVRLLLLCGLAMGIEAMYVNMISFLLLALEEQTDWDFSSGLDGFLASSLLWGCFVGNIVWSAASDVYGRRNIVVGAFFLLGISIYYTLNLLK
jgi:MFS family permease